VRARLQAQGWIGALALVAFAVGTMTPTRAPAGTVAEQRARLPPPATCTDPIAGTWKSFDYRARWGEWKIFTLEIRRVDDTDQLEGTIVNETWRGDPSQSEPGPCEGQLHYVVSMDAAGKVHDGRIEFGGVGQWRLDASKCSDFYAHYSRYNLDQFTGPLDLDRLEFQSVNNDGGRNVNEPTVFRRVECLEDPKAKATPPKVAVTPPAFYPAPEQEQPASAGCLAR